MMNDKNDGRIGKLPAAINDVNPEPKPDAKEITSVIREDGKTAGYRLSDGTALSVDEGVELAKQGGIKGVAVAHKKETEYLRTLPDNSEGNNLGSLPTEIVD